MDIMFRWTYTLHNIFIFLFLNFDQFRNKYEGTEVTFKSTADLRSDSDSKQRTALELIKLYVQNKKNKNLVR